jgi:hypothetical protein
MLSDLLFDTDYAPSLRAAFPAAVRAAADGDATPLLRLRELARPLAEVPPPGSFSAARYATVCEELPLPWARGAPFGGRAAEARRRADALGPGAFHPFDYATARADAIDLCLRWPEARVRPAIAPGPGPDVPTLILQGGEDLRTPPDTSARVAGALPRATRVVVPGVGHGVLASDPSRCASSRLRSWLRGAPAGPCPRVPTGAPRTGVPPRSLAAVPARGRTGAAARLLRTIAVLDATLDDAVFVLTAGFSSSGAGLRGGTFRLGGRRGLELHGVAWVPGVAISGAGTRDGGLALRVTGRAAARGRVTLSRTGVLRGRLAGHRVAVRLGSGPVRATAATAAAAKDVTPTRAFRHRRVLPVLRTP